MKILLLGKNGQVGWELQRALAPLGELVALGSQGAPSLHADFAHPEALAATVRTLRPQVIVNAAAHTAVDRCESEPDRARQSRHAVAQPVDLSPRVLSVTLAAATKSGRSRTLTCWLGKTA